jgi:HAE1 family hydrophobic/amphiphilic exporter-1
MNITELSVRRPTTIAVIFIVLVGLGIFAFTKLGADLFPQTDTPFISVRVVYPGADSVEIEKDVVKPIEDAVAGLAGVDKVRSVSGEGYGYVLLQFTMETKTDSALMDVQKAVDAIADNLPADAEKPVLHKFDINAQPILAISIYGDAPLDQLRARADDLQKVLENVQGVGTVTLVGAADKELDIVVDRTAIESYGIDLSTFIGVLRANNVTVPSGLMRQAGVDRPVRVVGEFNSLQDVRDLRVPLPRGGTIPLSELADVALVRPVDSHPVRMNGQGSVGLLVVKASDANVVKTADSVKAALRAAEASLPPGMRVSIASDSTIFITGSISETERDLVLGVIVTSLVLFLFLRKWRSSVIVLVAIPTCLVSTFFMMFICGFTLNVLSVMALALCIGILVDDSIVVLENIHRHHQMGESPRDAAVNGRMEIGMAAIAITLCDVVVFSPIAFMTDLVGQFFRQFGLTVVFATLFSLFVSFTITPAMASRLLASEARDEAAAAERRRRRAERRGKGPGGSAPAAVSPAPGTGRTAVSRPVDGGRSSLLSRASAYAEARVEAAGPVPRPPSGFFEEKVKPGYRHLLERALAHRGLVLGLVVVLVAGSIALVPLGLIQSEFIPPFDQGKIDIDLNLGAGADLARTDDAVRTFEEHLRAMPEVSDVFSQIGTDSGSNYGSMIVRLVDKTQRAKGQSQVARELRTWAKTLPGVDSSVREESIVSQTSIEGNKSLIINISGPDRAVLQDLAMQAESAVRKTQGAVDVQNSNRSRQTEVTVSVDRLALSEYGLSAADVATTLRAAFAGAKAGVYRSAGDEYDMMVKFRPDQVKTPLDVAQIRLRGPTGAFVTVGQVAAIAREDAALTLERSQRANIVTISANLQGRPLGAVDADVRSRLASLAFPPGYSWKLVGETSTMTTSFGNLGWALTASILLIYLVLVVLYESWLTPAIRLLSLPAGVIGGLAGLALTGKAVNIITFIGIIMLDGLVSKNGTLLIDYTNTLVKRGRSMRDALIEAGQTRLRPILMTSSTMIVGMLPLALSSGASSEIKSGMAIVLIGGLVTSTLISPFLIPVAYSLIDDARARRGKRAKEQQA